MATLLEESVVAEETRAGAFQVRIHTGNHSFLMDEPVAYGGLDTGPSPFDLLSAALSACTLMTMKLYAQRKGWAIEPLSVRVSHHKGTGGRDRFDRVIELGDVTDEQRAELLKIAGRCPVHQLFEQGADVTVSVAQTALAEPVADRLHAQEIEELCRDAA